MSTPSDPLAVFQERLGYTFRDPTHLLRALTHPSHSFDHPEDPVGHNQRLELLGDAVLQLIVTESLFHLFPNEREGVLSKSRSVLTRGGFLAQLAREIDLGAILRMGATEEQTDGRNRDSTLEDAFEALTGAIHLDSDYATAKNIVLRLYGPLPERLRAALPPDNPKGRLQEIVQPLHGNNALRYEATHVSGQDHERIYEAAVYLLGDPIGTGRGTSKKSAEEAAARIALTALEPDA